MMMIIMIMASDAIARNGMEWNHADDAIYILLF